jgi:Asp/Glu/hydantoin racemase
VRIRVINPFRGTEARGRKNLERIRRSDTEFDIVDIGESYPLRNNQFLYFRQQCTGPTLERVMEADRDGCDAVFISCNLDIGLYEARSLVNIPVTATLESAALVAHMMAARYSLITVDYQNGMIQRMLLRQYGLDGRLASHRSIGIDANELYPDRTPEDEVFRGAVAVAKRCVEQDGAELIIAGCTHIGSVLTSRMAESLEAIGAPVLDGMVTGFKMAEMMADTHCLTGLPPVSRLGYFQQPPEDDFRTLENSRKR